MPRHTIMVDLFLLAVVLVIAAIVWYIFVGQGPAYTRLPPR